MRKLRFSKIGASRLSGKMPSEADSLEQPKKESRPRLFQALLKNATIEEMDKLVADGALLNDVGPFQWSLLHLAVQEERSDVVQWLFRKEVSVDARESEGRTPFYFACESGQIDIAFELWRHQASLDSRDASGAIPFMIAAQQGKTKLLKRFFECLPKNQLNPLLKLTDQAGRTILHHACLCVDENNSAVPLILNEEIDVNAQTIKGETSLHIAFRKGFFSVVKMLLEKEIDVTLKDDRGETVLDIATNLRKEFFIEWIQKLIPKNEDAVVTESTFEFAALLNPGGVVEQFPRMSNADQLKEKVTISQLLPNFPIFTSDSPLRALGFYIEQNKLTEAESRWAQLLMQFGQLSEEVCEQFIVVTHHLATAYINDNKFEVGRSVYTRLDSKLTEKISLQDQCVFYKTQGRLYENYRFYEAALDAYQSALCLVRGLEDKKEEEIILSAFNRLESPLLAMVAEASLSKYNEADKRANSDLKILQQRMNQLDHLARLWINIDAWDNVNSLYENCENYIQSYKKVLKGKLNRASQSSASTDQDTYQQENRHAFNQVLREQVPTIETFARNRQLQLATGCYVEIINTAQTKLQNYDTTHIIERMNQLDSCLIDKQWLPVNKSPLYWHSYREKLLRLRETFEQGLSQSKSIADLQKQFSRGVLELLRSIIDNCLIFLGPPPCSFAILGLGSITRDAMCPFSDVDLAMLIQERQYRLHGYFQELLQLFNIMLNLCGEMNGLRLESTEITDLLSKEDPTLLDTPIELLNRFAPDPENPQKINFSDPKPYALYRPVLIYGSSATDEQPAGTELLHLFHSELSKRLQLAKPDMPENIFEKSYNLSYAHDPNQSEIEIEIDEQDENDNNVQQLLSTKLSFNNNGDMPWTQMAAGLQHAIAGITAVVGQVTTTATTDRKLMPLMPCYQQIALGYLTVDSQYQFIVENIQSPMTSEFINVKNQGVSLLSRWILDVALYFGCYTTSPKEALETLKKTTLPLAFINKLEEIYYTLNRLRANAHIRAKCESNTIEKPKAWPDIQRDVLLPAFEAVIALKAEPENANLIPFTVALTEAWWRTQIMDLFNLNHRKSESQEEETHYEASYVVRKWYWEKLSQKSGGSLLPRASYSVVTVPVTQVVEKQLFQEDKPPSPDGNSNRVSLLDYKGNPIADAQFYPKSAGTQWAVDQFNVRFGIPGAPASLIRLTEKTTHQVYPLWLTYTLGVPIQHWQDYSEGLEAFEQSLEPVTFTLSVLRHFILNCADNEFEHIVVLPTNPENTPTQTTQYRLMTVGGGSQAFINSLEVISTMQQEKMVQMVKLLIKSLSYCFSQMLNPVPKAAVIAFLLLDQNQIWNSWFQQLIDYENAVFGDDLDTSRPVLFPLKGHQSDTEASQQLLDQIDQLRMTFDPNVIVQCYHKWLKLEKRLKDTQSTETLFPTPLELLHDLDPQLAAYYENLLTQVDHHSPLARFKQLPDTYQVVPDEEAISQHTVDKKPETNLLEDSVPCHPQAAFQIFLRAKNDYGYLQGLELALTRDDWDQVETLFMSGKTETLEEALQQLNWEPFPKANEQKLLEKFSEWLSLKTVTIMGSKELDTGSLSRLLANLTQLTELKITRCPNVTKLNEKKKNILQRLVLGRNQKLTQVKILSPNLTRVHLYQLPVLKQVISQSLHMRELKIESAPLLTSDGIWSIAKNNLNLIYVNIMDCPLIGQNILLSHHPWLLDTPISFSEQSLFLLSQMDALLKYAFPSTITRREEFFIWKKIMSQLIIKLGMNIVKKVSESLYESLLYLSTQPYLTTDQMQLMKKIVEAVSMLGFLDPLALDRFNKLLADSGDVGVRKATVRAFIRLGCRTDATIKGLSKALMDKDLSVCIVSAKAMHQLGMVNSQLRSELQDKLVSKKRRYAITAAIALIQFGETSEKIIEILLKGLNSKKPYLRAGVAKACSQLSEEDTGVASTLMSIVAALLERLESDKDWVVRIYCSMALIKFGFINDQVQQCLVDAMSNEESHIRKKGIQAIARSSVLTQNIRNQLLECLNDEKWKVRSRAARTVGQLANQDNELYQFVLKKLQQMNNNMTDQNLPIILGELSSDNQMVHNVLWNAWRTSKYPEIKLKVARALCQRGFVKESIALYILAEFKQILSEFKKIFTASTNDQPTKIITIEAVGLLNIVSFTNAYRQSLSNLLLHLQYSKAYLASYIHSGTLHHLEASRKIIAEWEQQYFTCLHSIESAHLDSENVTESNAYIDVFLSSKINEIGQLSHKLNKTQAIRYRWGQLALLLSFGIVLFERKQSNAATDPLDFSLNSMIAITKRILDYALVVSLLESKNATYEIFDGQSLASHAAEKTEPFENNNNNNKEEETPKPRKRAGVITQSKIAATRLPPFVKRYIDKYYSSYVQSGGNYSVGFWQAVKEHIPYQPKVDTTLAADENDNNSGSNIRQSLSLIV